VQELPEFVADRVLVLPQYAGAPPTVQLFIVILPGMNIVLTVAPTPVWPLGQASGYEEPRPVQLLGWQVETDPPPGAAVVTQLVPWQHDVSVGPVQFPPVAVHEVIVPIVLPEQQYIQLLLVLSYNVWMLVVEETGQLKLPLLACIGGKPVEPTGHAAVVEAQLPLQVIWIS